MNASTNYYSDLSSEELQRYSRHLSLPEIGLDGQLKLKKSSVLCVGCGGLGSPLLLYLAAAGVGRIGIVDNDLVESSNLQRQIIHSTKSIGKEKVYSARQNILNVNPFCKVIIFKEFLTPKNALNILDGFDVICDCTDNFESRYLINDASIILKKPNIYGSVSKFEGQATVFNLNKFSPNLRDFIPEPPPRELLPSCSESGVVGIVPGIIGLIQATETIKIITQCGQSLSGRILIFDALRMSFKELKLEKNKQTKPIKELIDYKSFCNKSSTKINSPKETNIASISANKLKELMKTNINNIVIIDVRNEHEYIAHSIPGSLLFPLSRIESGEALTKIKEVTAHKEIFIHCQTGKRSKKAIIILNKFGINAKNLEGGIKAWEKI